MTSALRRPLPPLPLTQVAVPTGRVIDPPRPVPAELSGSLSSRCVPGGGGENTYSAPAWMSRWGALPVPSLSRRFPSPNYSQPSLRRTHNPPFSLPQWLRP